MFKIVNLISIIENFQKNLDFSQNFRKISHFNHNYINPGSQIPQVEIRKRCSRDLFTSSGRATALIDRHFWYTFLQQSMTC